MAEKSKPTDEKPQIEKFRDLARELETDDDESAFDERLNRLAKAPREAPKKGAPENGEGD